MSFKMKCSLMVSHLSFSNDFIIFNKYFINNIKKLMDTLSIFEKESSLSINYNKSYFITSNSITNHKNCQMASLTDIKHETPLIKYLGNFI